MSTRAIVGYKRTDGTITGSWNWCDGYRIKDNLIKDFNSLTDVGFILRIGMFSTIFSQKEYEDFIEWSKTENIDISDKVFIKYGNSIIVQDEHHLNRKATEYKNIEDVMSQDINVAYIFEDDEWKEYR